MRKNVKMAAEEEARADITDSDLELEVCPHDSILKERFFPGHERDIRAHARTHTERIIRFEWQPENMNGMRAS